VRNNSEIIINEKKPLCVMALLKMKKKGVFIGKGVRYFPPITIKGKGNVSIGKYTIIAPNFKIITSNHNFNYACMQVTLYNDLFGKAPGEIIKGDVEIGNDVWFGEDVTVLGGVKIGDGAIIGNNALVTDSVPPYAVAVGLPAKVIKYRFKKDMVRFLLNLKWWDWDKARMKRNKKFFFANLNKASVMEVKNLIKK